MINEETKFKVGDKIRMGLKLKEAPSGLTDDGEINWSDFDGCVATIIEEIVADGFYDLRFEDGSKLFAISAYHFSDDV